MNYLRRPEPGRIITRERVIERTVEKQPPSQPPIDMNTLISAITQAIQSMPTNKQSILNAINPDGTTDEFDNSKTMEKIADNMTVQRGKKESNFDNLGNEHQTKIDKKEVEKTIDLLSNLDD